MRTVATKTSGCSQLIAGGVVASIGASICCLGPFMLLATGVSGAWMSRLMMLEPFQPILAGISLTAFAIAGIRLLRVTPSSVDVSSCETRSVGWGQSALYFLCLALALVLVSSEYWIVLLA